MKKLAIAPNNESLIINILRFIGVIDAEGKKTEKANDAFSKHSDEEFQAEFSKLIEASYSGIFELHHDAAWQLPAEKLISYFRNEDRTSDLVGRRQTQTFQTLAGLAGRVPIGAVKAPATAKKLPTKVVPTKSFLSMKENNVDKTAVPPVQLSREVGLSVKIEINLPVAPDQATYDRIFRSIRENLING